jgi:hypothetical protein
VSPVRLVNGSTAIDGPLGMVSGRQRRADGPYSIGCPPVTGTTAPDT